MHPTRDTTVLKHLRRLGAAGEAGSGPLIVEDDGVGFDEAQPLVVAKPGVAQPFLLPHELLRG